MRIEKISPTGVQLCEWFAKCDHPATGPAQPHPILVAVPICDRCRAKIAYLSDSE